MARVTVEDCIKNVSNRFKLVLIAGQRARELTSGAEETVEKSNDKPAVTALREIGGSTVSLKKLENSIIQNFQYYTAANEDEDVTDEMESDELAWSIQMAELEKGMTGMHLSDDGEEDDISSSDTDDLSDEADEE